MGHHLFNRIAELHVPSMEALKACAIRQVIIQVVMDPWEPRCSACSARNASMRRTVTNDMGSQWLAMHEEEEIACGRILASFCYSQFSPSGFP